MSTFVSVGNAHQPFDRLVNSVVSNLEFLPQPVFIQYATSKVPLGAACGAPYLAMDEFEQRVVNASLLIMHAGAGSLIHAVRAGKIPVVMTRLARFGEHIDDHQVEFAEEMKKANRIVLCRDGQTLLPATQIALDLQSRSSELGSRSRLIDLIDANLRAYLGAPQ